ncbi:MAG TPA: ABC transporter substrate-binding protein [Clostridia bacterium]|nr:ABC transporter substrate-binding protein [Clostridia bacterium]
MKKIILIVMLMLVLTSCSSNTVEVVPNNEITTEQWNRLLDSSEGTIVNLLYYSKEQPVIEWIKNDFSKDLSIKYDIDLRLQFMELSKIEDLLLEAKSNEENHDYDIIYISNDGFRPLKEKGLLYPDVLKKLPNYYTNINHEAYSVNYDEGIPIEFMEVPVFKDQLVFIHNEDIIYETPTNFDDFKALAKENKGEITYPHPSTDTGLAFILSGIASKVDLDALNQASANKDEIYTIVKPGLDYLIDLDSYLYESGETYPKNEVEMDELYINGDLLFTMTMDYNKATEKISEETFMKASNTYVMQEGTTGFLHYFAVPDLADNKAGALVVINDIISGETQANIYGNFDMNKLPIVDHNNMPTNELSHLRSVDIKYTSIGYDELSDYFIPEIRSDVRQIIVELWREYVE